MPRYPQGNGQAESTNKTIIDGLKKRLEDKKDAWADELDGVLWSHRTIPRRATGKMSFSLSHGIEAMALAEVNAGSLHCTMMTQVVRTNNRLLRDKLDTIKEERDQALL